MNNQFDNLMYEAGLTAQGCWDEMDEYDRNAILKFAELIVRECIQNIRDNMKIAKVDTLGDKDLFLETLRTSGHFYITELERHFGVEESRREKFRKSFEEAFKDGVDLSGRETP